jgi:ubiquinone/menaquinone biosynthesis C-methylase UbiE
LNLDNFAEQSYEKHSTTYAKHSNSDSCDLNTISQTDSVDYWRHLRKYHTLDPLIAESPDNEWLTVGDGNYGRDGRYIFEAGCNVTATDIDDTLLKKAVKVGFIPKCSKENAEFFSFGPDSYDYVLCKEAYHHFPRPAIALYEMIRVARKGVILIEPNDSFLLKSFINTLFSRLKNILKRWLGRNPGNDTYEESGNYVYSISRRELHKVAQGLNLKAIAFRGINCHYIKEAGAEKISDNGPIQKRIKRRIWFEDLLCKIGIMDYKMLTAVIFKSLPSSKLMESLKKHNYEVIILPQNPYSL